MKNILYTIILSLLFSSAASAEIYKWVDDEGKVHYGEKLPNNATGKAVETIKTKDSVSADFQAGLDAYKKGDYATSLKIYRAAAEQGDIMAQFTLGGLYTSPGKFRRHGVTQDYKEAAKWFRLAAEQGEDIAQFMLGQIYRNGKGVTRNLVIAHMWFNLAATNGDKKTREVAKKNMEAVAEQMTSEQITKATELGRECILKFLKDCG